MNVLAPRRFIRWSFEKRLRSMSPVTDSAFLRAKQTVTGSSVDVFVNTAASGGVRYYRYTASASC